MREFLNTLFGSLTEGYIEVRAFHPINDSQGIFAVPHDHDAANHFSCSIQLRYPSSHIRTDRDMRDIPDGNRCALLIRADWDYLEISE